MNCPESFPAPPPLYQTGFKMQTCYGVLVALAATEQGCQTRPAVQSAHGECRQVDGWATPSKRPAKSDQQVLRRGVLFHIHEAHVLLPFPAAMQIVELSRAHRARGIVGPSLFVLLIDTVSAHRLGVYQETFFVSFLSCISILGCRMPPRAQIRSG